jgi:Secretion system C-terminal sorting domain
MEKAEYQAAFNLLQEYAGTGDAENDDYYSVNEMQLEWALNAQTAIDMSPTQEATLRDIAEHYTRASTSARVILNQVFNDQYEAPYYSDTSERKGYFEDESIAEQNGTIAVIAPNPANNEAIISYKLFEGIATAELQIWNVTGQLVKKFTITSNETQLKFETKQLVETIYIIKLICNSVLIDKQKLVIQH